MATLDLTVDIKAASKDLKSWQKRKVPTAAKRAINKALRGGFTDTKTQLKKRISMPVRKIGERVKLSLAKERPRGYLKVVGPRRGKEYSNLGSFKIKLPKKSISGKRRLGKSGVRARVYGESRLKAYKGAFAWTRPGKSGDAVTIFKRVRGAAKVAPGRRVGRNKDGSSDIRRIKRGPRKGKVILRQPIKPVYGASLIREFTRPNRRGQKAVITLVRASMRVRFIKEFNRLLTKL